MRIVKRRRKLLLTLSSLIFVMMIISSCGNDMSGTYYDWRYAKEGNSKIVLKEDGKCTVYSISEEDSSEGTAYGEYTKTEDGIMIHLETGRYFELAEKEGDYLFDDVDDTTEIRWYKDRDKAIGEWEKCFNQCNKSIENTVYYSYYSDWHDYDSIQSKECIYFLDIKNLDEDGNAEYEVYESDEYDSDYHTNADINKELWGGKKHLLERGELSFDYSGYLGYINSNSDFLLNCRYIIRSKMGVDSIFSVYDGDNVVGDWYKIRP